MISIHVLMYSDGEGGEKLTSFVHGPKVLRWHDTAIMVLFTVTAAILDCSLSYATNFKTFAILSAPAEIRFLCFCVVR